MAHASRYFQIGVVSIQIDSDISDVLNDYARLYQSFEIDHPLPGSLTFCVSRGHRQPWTEPEYVVRAQDRVSWAGTNPLAALPELEATINQQVIVQRSDLLQFHACVMEKDGRGVLFPADSGTGKTTLSAALVRRGWRHLSDEFALVDPTSLKILPFPKALCVKESGVNLFDSFGLNLRQETRYLLRGKYPRYYVPPEWLGRQCIGQACRVNAIFFLARPEGSQLKLRPISESEAAMYLYRAGLNTLTYRRRGFEMAIALARHATNHILHLGSPAETADLIDRVVSGAYDCMTKSSLVA